MSLLGCVADDFTGATDLAAALASSGHRTVVTVGPPPSSTPECDAVVVALKTRTCPPEQAVRETLDAVAGLRALGAERWFFKYCSTFDSTPRGNIGPVADALLAETGAGFGVVVPSYPANGRRVHQRILFVHGVPLAESPMRDHPLTPMLDSDVVRLLSAQSRSEVQHVPLEVVRDPGGLEAAWSRAAAAAPALVVVDAIDDSDLAAIAASVPPDALLTGGAALGAHLVPAATARAADRAILPAGPGLVLAGSASVATREQVAVARRSMAAVQMDRARLVDDREGETTRLVTAALDAAGRSESGALVFATADADDLGPAADRDRDAALIERCLADVAVRAVAGGVRRVVVAGGETSGAVVGALGVSTLEVVTPIAPGVVWCRAGTGDGEPLALALKSGNFGGPSLFLDAWDVLR